MSGSLAFGLACFTALFPIIDPVGVVPMFLALTAGDSVERRHAAALSATLTMFGVLTVFAVSGLVIFRFFGITMPAFKIAGGVLLFMVALDMLRATPSPTRTSPEETAEGIQKDDVGVIPLGMPLLSGPGAIASVIVLSEKASEHPNHLPYELGLVGAIGLMACLTWLLLRFATPIARIFGKTGLNLVTRIMGLVLAAIAAQYVIDGVQTALHLDGL